MKWGPEGEETFPEQYLALELGAESEAGTLERSFLLLRLPATTTHTFMDPHPAVPCTHPHLFLDLCAQAFLICHKTRLILLSATPWPGLETSACLV